MRRDILITHAKMAQVFVHAPLFRSLEKGQQKKQKLDVAYNVGDTSFRFWGPEPLGALDLRVLQGLVALATYNLPLYGGVKSMLRDGRLRKGRLRLDGEAITEKTIAVRFLLTSFARLLGYLRPGQATLTRIRESIERISAVTVVVQRLRSRGSYHLLSGYFEEAATREVVVGLNPIITRAVLRKNDFLRVDMSEVRALKSDAARLIHSRLHWINHGAQRGVRLETLCGYLYGDYMVSRSALANRKATVRKALRELQKIGWVVTEIRDETFLVGRPRLPGRLRSNNELPHGQTVNVLRSNAERHYDEGLVTC